MARYSRRRLLAATGLLVSGRAGTVKTGTTVRAATAQSRGPSPRSVPEREWRTTAARGTYNAARQCVEIDGILLVAATARTDERIIPWVLGLDRTSGEIDWQRVVPDPDRPAGRQTLFVDAARDDGAGREGRDDGHAVVLGTVGGPESRGIELLGIRADGAVLWRQVYEPPADDGHLVGSSVTPIDDGFLQSGYRTTGASIQGFVSRVGPEGGERWRHGFFPDQRSSIVGAFQRDGSYIGLALLQSTEPGTPARSPVRSALFEFEADGTVTWRREYAVSSRGTTNQSNQLRDGIATADGFLLAGQTRNGTDGTTGGWIVATDTDGRIRRQSVVFPRPYTTLTTVDGRNGRYYVGGAVAEAAGTTPRRGWLARVRADTTVVWQVSQHLDAATGVTDVTATEDATVAVAGQTTRATTPGTDPDTVSRAWLAKFDDAEEITMTPTPTGTPSPTPTSSVTPPSTPTHSSTPTREPSTIAGTAAPTQPDDPDATTAGGGPGFTLGGTVAGLAGLAGLGGLLASRWRSDATDESSGE